MSVVWKVTRKAIVLSPQPDDFTVLLHPFISLLNVLQERTRLSEMHTAALPTRQDRPQPCPTHTNIYTKPGSAATSFSASH